MIEYEFLKILDSAEGYVIRSEVLDNVIASPAIDSSSIFEISYVMHEKGPQIRISRMDDIPYIGKKVEINPNAIVYKTRLDKDSPIIKFIEEANDKASRSRSPIIT